MSIELANADGIIGQVASTRGYSDLIAAADDSEDFPMALRAFFQRGFTDAIEGCIADLKKLAKSDESAKDVASTASNLAKMMDGETFVILTDGTSNEKE